MTILTEKRVCMKIEVNSNKYVRATLEDCKKLDMILFIFMLETTFYDDHLQFSEDGNSTMIDILVDRMYFESKMVEPRMQTFVNNEPFNKYIGSMSSGGKQYVYCREYVTKFFKKYTEHDRHRLNRHLYKLKALGFINFDMPSYDKKFRIQFTDEMKNFFLSGSSFEYLWKNSVLNSFAKYVIPPLMLAIGIITLYIKLEYGK